MVVGSISVLARSAKHAAPVANGPVRSRESERSVRPPCSACRPGSAPASPVGCRPKRCGKEGRERRCLHHRCLLRGSVAQAVSPYRQNPQSPGWRRLGPSFFGHGISWPQGFTLSNATAPAVRLPSHACKSARTFSRSGIVPPDRAQNLLTILLRFSGKEPSCDEIGAARSCVRLIGWPSRYRPETASSRSAVRRRSVPR